MKFLNQCQEQPAKSLIPEFIAGKEEDKRSGAKSAAQNSAILLESFKNTIENILMMKQTERCN